MSIRWTIENVTQLPPGFLSEVLKNAVLAESVSFGQTGRGIAPNYQVTRGGRVVGTFRGSTHAAMREEQFDPGNMSRQFSIGELSVRRGSGSEDASRLVEVDAEALRLLDAYAATSDAQFIDWLPRYEKSLAVISDAMQSDDHSIAFDLIWRKADNDVSNAGQGKTALPEELVERLRPELARVLADIWADGSPANHEAITTRFVQLQREGRIRSIPHLLIARAFASLHPELYHTTVDRGRHDRVIRWFETHAGFVAPADDNWARRAAALVRHMDALPGLAASMYKRNMFPWFVEMHAVAAQTAPGAPPVAKERVEGKAVVFTEAVQREINFRENRLQNQLARELREEFGPDLVWMEKPTGNGTRADLFVVTRDGRRRLYEVKSDSRAMGAIRRAVGQLLEYAYLPGGLDADELIVAADAEYDRPAQEFIAALRARCNIDISYRRVVLAETVSLAETARDSVP